MLKFYSSKKGTLAVQKQLLHLGMMIIAVAVITILYLYVKSVEKDTELYRVALSRDTSLLLNTFYASPGSVEYVYSNSELKLDKFRLDFGPGNNEVPLATIKEKALETSYPYAKTRNGNYPNDVSGKSIKFSKNGDKLIVENE